VGLWGGPLLAVAVLLLVPVDAAGAGDGAP
jgi:hypothetical protein